MYVCLCVKCLKAIVKSLPAAVFLQTHVQKLSVAIPFKVNAQVLFSSKIAGIP